MPSPNTSFGIVKAITIVAVVVIEKVADKMVVLVNLAENNQPWRQKNPITVESHHVNGYTLSLIACESYPHRAALPGFELCIPSTKKG